MRIFTHRAVGIIMAIVSIWLGVGCEVQAHLESKPTKSGPVFVQPTDSPAIFHLRQAAAKAKLHWEITQDEGSNYHDCQWHVRVYEKKINQGDIGDRWVELGEEGESPDR